MDAGPPGIQGSGWLYSDPDQGKGAISTACPPGVLGESASQVVEAAVKGPSLGQRVQDGVSLDAETRLWDVLSLELLLR